MKTEKDEYVLASEDTHCLCCGSLIEYGRSDKKFCCQQCKDKFHNRGKNHMRYTKLKIDRIMTANYEILNGLIKLKVSQIPLSDMVAMGFNPNYVTSYSNGRGAAELSCYDISFKLSPTRVFNIRRMSVSLQQLKIKK